MEHREDIKKKKIIKTTRKNKKINSCFGPRAHMCVYLERKDASFSIQLIMLGLHT